MWIGPPGSTNCLAVGNSNCTNQSSFVFLQQIQFGNSALGNASTVSVGQCTPTTIMNTSGIVQNYITDSRAALSGGAQTNMKSLWQSDPNSTPLVDGQVAYIVETYFQSPDLSVGGLSGNGVYARYFF
jgi:hypothetical protein